MHPQRKAMGERFCYTVDMKLTAVVRLQPIDDQYRALLHTLERANAACNWLSEQAWQIQAFGQFGLHKLYYRDLRADFDLSAQLAVRCIGKVASSYKIGLTHLREICSRGDPAGRPYKSRQLRKSYKKDRRARRTFKPHGAVAYDSRILNWRVADKQVSIWTLGGRTQVNFICGKHHELLLQYQQGESDLVYRKAGA
jgi:putative transposase